VEIVEIHLASHLFHKNRHTVEYSLVVDLNLSVATVQDSSYYLFERIDHLLSWGKQLRPSLNLMFHLYQFQDLLAADIRSNQSLESFEVARAACLRSEDMEIVDNTLVG
jgi:hypothetical protein